MGNPAHRHPRYLFRDQTEVLHSVVPASGPPPRILVPLDGSPLAERILPLVRTFVRGRDGAKVYLLGVMPLPHQGPSTEARPTADYLEQVLTRWTPMLDAEVRYDSMAGDAAKGILDFAIPWNPTLIAMATHGRTGLERIVRGSVTEQILRHATAPVLAANPFALAADHPTFSRILVPLDGSRRSMQVLGPVADLAEVTGAEVVLLHVLAAIPSGGDHPVGTPLTRADAEALLEAARAGLVSRGIPVRVLCREGRPGAAILEVARDERADLVALATHGRTGLARLVMGSVTEEVLRTCRCPTLSVRTVPAPAPSYT